MLKHEQVNTIRIEWFDLKLMSDWKNFHRFEVAMQNLFHKHSPMFIYFLVWVHIEKSATKFSIKLCLQVDFLLLNLIKLRQPRNLNFSASAWNSDFATSPNFPRNRPSPRHFPFESGNWGFYPCSKLARKTIRNEKCFQKEEKSTRQVILERHGEQFFFT